MAAVAIDPARCPNCGARNACTMAAGVPGPCWCTEVVVPAAVLDALPAEAKDVACLCAKCIANAGPRDDEARRGNEGTGRTSG